MKVSRTRECTQSSLCPGFTKRGMAVSRLLYPERLLTQHFLDPSMREAMNVASLETSKNSFTSLVHLLKDGGDESLHGIRKNIEQVYM